LFNLFASSTRKKISFRDFNDLSDNIEKECNNSIVVRNYRVSVENAAARFPDIFNISNQDRTIERLDEDHINTLISVINRGVPNYVLDAMRKVIQDHLS
jgi:hypothetical protein